MRIQRLTKQKLICTIDNAVFVHTYMNGKKYVTIIRTPMVTQVITYKTEEEQYLDTFKRIKTMCGKRNANYYNGNEDLWKYWYYYTTMNKAWNAVASGTT